jgi:hypothetical protein
LFLRRLYTAIFGASACRQEARLRVDPNLFEGRLSSRSTASTRAAERALFIDCAETRDAHG